LTIIGPAVSPEPSPTQPTDAQLARRVLACGLAGAEGEEAELYRRFAPRVRLYGLRHLREEHAAADLVQRVLLLTIEKLRAGAVREPERIASFVLGVARMTAREMRRGAGREIPLPEEMAGREDLTHQPPEPLARDHLSRCLGELRERDRTVVVLTYYQEQDAREIAAALGLKEGHVRVVRHRAIGRLRECMGLEEES
jgi:RNA polymerase sigma-70 factor (ECF subfamily)